MDIIRKEIIIFFLCSFIFLSFFSAKVLAGESMPSLAQSLAENAIALERATRDLDAANLLLLEKNTKIRSELEILEKQEPDDLKKAQELGIQADQAKTARAAAAREYSIFLRKNMQNLDGEQSLEIQRRALEEQKAVLLSEQEKISSQVASLSEDIVSFEQQAFLEQRKQKEVLQNFRSSRVSGRKFLDERSAKEKDFESLLNILNSTLMNSYRQIASCRLEEKSLTAELVRVRDEEVLAKKREQDLLQEADQRKKAQQEKVDALIAQKITLQQEAQEFKKTKDLTASEDKSRQEVLAQNLFQLEAEGQSLQAEASRLSQIFDHFGK